LTKFYFFAVFLVLELYIGMVRVSIGPIGSSAFAWLDGTRVDYNNFVDGESAIEDCVKFDVNTGFWSSVTCSTARNYACQREASK